MGILSITTDTAGQVNVNPRRVKIITNDNLATITTAGYLNPISLQGYIILPTDFLDIDYSFNTATNSGTLETFTASFSNGVITLNQWTNPGDVLLPVVSGDFAAFNGTSGQIKDFGYLPSNAAKTNVVMANGATIANHIGCYTDTAGTIGVDATTAINGGNLQAGLTTGVAGSFISCPATTTTGSLALTAVANSGNFNNVIRNASTGQATAWVFGDPGTATTNIMSSIAGISAGNLVKGGTNNTLLADAGAALLAKTTSAFAGGSTSNTFTATGLTASSIVTANILTSTNSVSITKAVPGTNTLAITFSADPGANTTVNYIQLSAAV